MAIELETGEFLLSPEEAQELLLAAEAMRGRGLRPIDVMRPISFNEWFDLIVIQAVLNGEDETISTLLGYIDVEIEKRRRPH